MQKLTGKIALVTGASKGIGASIAEHLANAGATTYINYASSKSGADALVEKIKKAGGNAIAVQGDVSDSKDLARIFSTIKENHDHLDILVNNAGLYRFSPLEEITESDLHGQFKLNVFGLLFASQGAVDIMPAVGGSIINIGSIAGSMPAPNGAVYNATKAAVDSITMTLAKELGPRMIRVNSINPGPIETEGTTSAGLIGEAFDEMLKMTPLGRYGSPGDIGPVAAFLASDDARWVTGQRINVSGGLTV